MGDDNLQQLEKLVSLDTAVFRIFDLHKEILEQILSMVSVFDLLKFKNCSNGNRKRLEELLDSKFGRRIWMKGCIPFLTTTTCSVLMKIIASFQTSVDENIRLRHLAFTDPLAENDGTDDVWSAFWEHPNGLELPSATWEYALEIESSLVGKISHLPIHIEFLKDLERNMKDQFQIIYWSDWNKISPTWPSLFILTCGSTLYQTMAPVVNSENSYFYENMNQLKRAVQLNLRDNENKILSCRVVMFENESQKYSEDILPKLRPVIILTTHFGLHLCPVNEGKSARLSINYEQPQNGNHDLQTFGPVYAVYKGHIGVLIQLNDLRVYRVRIDEETGDIEIPTYVPLHSPQQPWDTVICGQKSFVTSLRRGWNFPLEEKSTAHSIHQPDSLEFVFSFISPEFGCLQFGYTAMYTTKPKCIEPTHGIQHTCLSEYGTIISWSDKAVGYAYSDEGYGEWEFTEWASATDDQIAFVSLVEIIAHNCVMLCSSDEVEDGDIRIIIAKLALETSLSGDLSLSISIVRTIPIKLENPYIISNFHFDFDHGIPYIFIVAERGSIIQHSGPFPTTVGRPIIDSYCGILRPPQIPKGEEKPVLPDSPLTFKLMKLTFENRIDMKTGNYYMFDIEKYKD